MINTAIYSKHRLIAQSLQLILQQSSEITVPFVVFDKETLLDKMRKCVVNILIVNLLDISHNDLDLLISLKLKFPKTSILILTDNCRDDLVSKAIKAGAKGFLTFESEVQELMQAVYTIRGGHDFYSESITHILLGRYIDTIDEKKIVNEESDDESDSLSSRQIEILKLWGESFSNQEIADKLFISVRTVETHKNHIMQKLNLKSSVDLIKFAIKNNIIKL